MIEFFGELYMDKFDFPIIEEFKAWKLKQKVPNTNRTIKKSTVDRCLLLLSRILNLAVEWEYLEKNQVPKIKLFGEKNIKERILTPEEGRLLLQKAEKCPKYLKPVIAVALNIGVRKGVNRNLEWTQFNFENDPPIVTIHDTKGKKTYINPINKTLLKELLEWKEKNPCPDSPYVFTNPKTGKPYTDTSIYRAWNRVCKLAGIEGVRFHDCRHTYGTRLIKSNDIITVRDLLGHSSVRMTERYAHSNWERKKKAVESLENYTEEKEPKKTEKGDNLWCIRGVEKSPNKNDSLSHSFSGRYN